jgi:hypothetical protein
LISPTAADTRAAVVTSTEVEPDRLLRTEPLGAEVVADVLALESGREFSVEDRDEGPDGEPEVLEGSADATPCPVATAAPTPRARASGPIRATTPTQRDSASNPGRLTPGFLTETMMLSVEP